MYTFRRVLAQRFTSPPTSDSVTQLGTEATSRKFSKIYCKFSLLTQISNSHWLETFVDEFS